MHQRLRTVAATTGIVIASAGILGMTSQAFAAEPSTPAATDTYPAAPGGSTSPVSSAPKSSSSSTASAQVSDSTVVPGQAVTVTGGGFNAGEQVSVDIHSAVVHLATVSAGASGDAAANVSIPASFSGTHEITLTGLTSGHVDSVTVRVVASAAPTTASNGGTLAYTGAAIIGTGVLGAGLLAGGAGLVLAARRRTAQD